MSERENFSSVEHSASDVSGPRGHEQSLRNKLIIALLLGSMVLGVIWFNALMDRHQPELQKAGLAAAYSGEKYTAPPVIPAKTETTELLLPAGSADPSTPQNQVAPSPIFAYAGGNTIPDGRPGPLPHQLATVDTGTATAPPSPAPTDTSNLARKLKPTVLNGTVASVIQNPDMVITEGTVMPCVLETAINTELAGFVTCVIPVDVRGTSGNVVLLDRGTKIVGQIESGLVQGLDRVFVLWTRAETPEHVIIALNAPGADELGRAGLPGAVDNHWWDRFGGALMLTLVQGALNAGTALAANSGSNGSNGVALGFVYGAQSSGNQVANTALENTINIPPTLNKNQGDTVSVFVIQDLDFSSVYALKLKEQAHDP